MNATALCVTPQMAKAGEDMAALLIDVSIAKSMGGLGGSCALAKRLEGTTNADLARAYANDDITSVTAIYAAMRREVDTGQDW